MTVNRNGSNRNGRLNSPDGAGRGGRGRRNNADGNAAGGGKKRNWFVRHKIATVILSVMLVGLVAFGIFFLSVISDPLKVLTRSRTPAPTDDPTEAVTDAATPTADTTTETATIEPTATEELPPDYDFTKDTVNFLVLGTDANAVRVKEGMNARTDCVILVSINVNTKKVSLISIPRDTYVKIYNEKNKYYSKNRINAAFTFGGGLKKNGITFAMNTVNQFLAKGKIPIDHYVLFDMDLVKNLVDAVGGVDIKVTGMAHDTVTTVTGVTFHNNTVMHMNGFEALTYARDRHNTVSSDEGRVMHQQDVMVALLKTLQKKGNIVKVIPQLFTTFQDNLSTDIKGLDEILALAWIAKDIDSSGIKQYRIDGSGMGINNASILIADQSNKAQIVSEVFGPQYSWVDSTWTKARLQAEITAMLNASQDIVNKAKTLLNNNTGFYTSEEAQALRNAIDIWQAAANSNDTDGMSSAAQDVKTEYDILQNLINSRKTTPTPEPTATPTIEPSTDAPTATPV
jgi:polyisoprenyl-teichoic acid--peptidoglycan teichoic acid transferase